jgi:hypothetical protein
MAGAIFATNSIKRQGLDFPRNGSYETHAHNGLSHADSVKTGRLFRSAKAGAVVPLYSHAQRKFYRTGAGYH